MNKDAVGKMLAGCSMDGLSASEVIDNFRELSYEGTFDDDVTLLMVRVKK